MGLTDHYVASLKGQLFSALENITIVDISHDVQPFNIAQAAFYLNNSWKNFPKGTIHFIHVDSTPRISIGNPEQNLYPMAMELEAHYFVGCDNGIFSLIEGYENASAYVQLDFSSAGLASQHSNQTIYIPAIAQLLKGQQITGIGEELNSPRQAFTTRATTTTNLIKGTVIHVDKYGNVILNIKRSLFEEVGQSNPFIIYFKSPGYYIDQISENYSDVPMGEKLARFNENDLLEIAINKGTVGSGGGASSLLGLQVKDIVRIEFHPKGSKNTIEDLFTE